jgi:hypothetical protein
VPAPEPLPSPGEPPTPKPGDPIPTSGSPADRCVPYPSTAS